MGTVRRRRRRGQTDATSMRAALLSQPGVMGRFVPAPVRWVLGRLEEAGQQAFLVGGAVRDLLLGRPLSGDWDVATDASPERVAEVFPKTRPTGIQHGTVTVLAGRRAVEVTTYRVEGAYSDHRRPDWVEFTSRLEEDLARRDFTINAMALSSAGRLHDPHGGRDDLSRRLVRAVGNASERFKEDALRMLRGVRIAAQLGFSIDGPTREAMVEHAPLLDHVSQERIRDEFNKLIVTEDVYTALRELKDTGLLQMFIPELLEGVGFEQNVHHRYTVWEHNIRCCQAIKPQLHLRLAGLFHDVAKPRTLSIGEDGGRHFYHHEVVGAKMTSRIMRRMKYDNGTRKKVVHLVRHHLALHHYPDMGDAGVRRLIRRIGLENLEDLIYLRMADRAASGTKKTPLSRGARLLLSRIEKVLQEDAAFNLKDLAIDGHDIMQVLDIGPGPHIGSILNEVLEAVLEEPALNDKDKLVELVKTMAPRHIDGRRSHDSTGEPG